MTVGDLDTTKQILSTVYMSGIDGMDDGEKATVINKLMELVQRKDGKIEDLVGVVKDLHSRCYRFISMRDGLHRLRTRALDLQTQLRDAEVRLNEVLSEEEKTKEEMEEAKRLREEGEKRLENLRESKEKVDKSLKRTNDKLRRK